MEYPIATGSSLATEIEIASSCMFFAMLFRAALSEVVDGSSCAPQVQKAA